MSLIPLAEIPQIIYTQAPQLSDEQIQEVERQHNRLMHPSHGYDDPVMMVASVSPERIEVFDAPYSWKMALDENPHWDYAHSLFGAHMLIHEGSRVLLAQRALTMMIRPGGWSWSCAGGVDPNEHPQSAVMREAQEELGLREEHFTDIKFHGIDTYFGVSCVWTGRLKDPDMDFIINPSEVAQVKWVEMKDLQQVPNLSRSIQHFLSSKAATL